MRVFIDGMAIELFDGAKVKDAFLSYFSSCIDSALSSSSLASSLTSSLNSPNYLNTSKILDLKKTLRKKISDQLKSGELKVLDVMENERFLEGSLSDDDALKTVPNLKTLISTEVNNENF
ncbi:MAG: hypothetical protein HQK49_14815 [Oligoflexia bacterium]|nr:hypothetical protein [Oligoflexia bacterium]